MPISSGWVTKRISPFRHFAISPSAIRERRLTGVSELRPATRPYKRLSASLPKRNLSLHPLPLAHEHDLDLIPDLVGVQRIGI